VGEASVNVDAVSDGFRGDGEVGPRRGKRVMGQPEKVRRVKRRRESVGGPGRKMVRDWDGVWVIGAGDWPLRGADGDRWTDNGDGGIYRRRLLRRAGVGVVGTLDEGEEELTAVGGLRRQWQITSTAVHGGGWRRREGDVAVV